MVQKIRESNKRCVGNIQEYPGSTVWKEYQYRCPECKKWHNGSNTTTVHEDGTESYLCEKCEEQVAHLFA